MISFRDLHTPEEVANWAAHLDQRWPERSQIRQHISQVLQALSFNSLQVLELCPGHGNLAEYLLLHLPHMQYLGLDSSVPLLNFARKRLASREDNAEDNVKGKMALYQVDLNDDAWLDEPIWDNQPIKQVRWQAIVSMQSLHDLGTETEINRIYRLAKDLLVSGGLFLNADLIVPQAIPDHPGRLTIARHLDLLQSHGFVNVTCSLAVGEFACIRAKVPSLKIDGSKGS